MDKRQFTSIVLGIDALTIGAFGTACYESGRPIVGVIFLFALVIVSGIAFGFVLNQDDAQKYVVTSKPSTPSEEITRRMGVEMMENVLKEVREMPKAEHCKGLCTLLGHELQRYGFHPTEDKSVFFPFFNYQNAINFGGAIQDEERGYWWPYGSKIPRMKFLIKMIQWQKNEIPTPEGVTTNS